MISQNRPALHLPLLPALLLLLSISSLLPAVDAFQIQCRPTRSVRTPRTQLCSSNGQPETASAPSQRKILLSRKGPHFALDRSSGRVEFGATAQLTTQLAASNHNNINDNNDAMYIKEWIADERALANSIWDESLIQELRPSVYQLQVMPLQFVTIQLAPSVDVKMQTRYAQNDPDKPVFLLQSVGFDPNIQLLPGLSVTAEDLGINIQVSGELKPMADGVSGRIAFQTSGILPGPLRILPQAALQAAANTINQAVVNFAIDSFQKGATTKYREFVLTKQQQAQQY
ncbi:expressed unknown protein [Seminavis robusta]|uniref:Uncharacterized protein n=1 Tax=Seminavis robusta TaxID=568900 RepID=A0A9N8H226_9STRA|nr:expressed unknown protein [Seminavis robusta]|eukprot:Sro55_g032360.1 n/a (286) ;mRNA; f:83844-84701